MSPGIDDVDFAQLQAHAGTVCMLEASPLPHGTLVCGMVFDDDPTWWTMSGSTDFDTWTALGTTESNQKLVVRNDIAYTAWYPTIGLNAGGADSYALRFS